MFLKPRQIWFWYSKVSSSKSPNGTRWGMWGMFVKMDIFVKFGIFSKLIFFSNLFFFVKIEIFVKFGFFVKIEIFSSKLTLSRLRLTLLNLNEIMKWCHHNLVIIYVSPRSPASGATSRKLYVCLFVDNKYRYSEIFSQNWHYQIFNFWHFYQLLLIFSSTLDIYVNYWYFYQLLIKSSIGCSSKL